MIIEVKSDNKVINLDMIAIILEVWNFFNKFSKILFDLFLFLIGILFDVNKKIDDMFILRACEILANSKSPLTWSKIIKICDSYAKNFNVSIPVTFSNYNFVKNKKKALYDNLRAFDGKQQFIIINEMCEFSMFDKSDELKKLKEDLFINYSKFLNELEIKATGWVKIDKSILEMKNRLDVASTEVQYQTIGMIGRETLITIAQQVFDFNKHGRLNDVEISKTDVKRMLEVYLNYELNELSEKVIKFAKSAVDLSNQLTHDRNATKLEAELCLIAISSVANLIKTIAKK